MHWVYLSVDGRSSAEDTGEAGATSLYMFNHGDHVTHVQGVVLPLCQKNIRKSATFELWNCETFPLRITRITEIK